MCDTSNILAQFAANSRTCSKASNIQQSPHFAARFQQFAPNSQEAAKRSTICHRFNNMAPILNNLFHVRNNLRTELDVYVWARLFPTTRWLIAVLKS